jgi:hypothetical protein
MDQISAELLDDGSIEITLAYRDDDEAVLNATFEKANSERPSLNRYPTVLSS